MPVPELPRTPPALPSERKDRRLVVLFILNGVLGLLLFVVLVFVIPVFAAMFKDFGSKLPMPTQLLIDLSNFVKAWWWLLFVPLGALLTSGFHYLERSFGRPVSRRGVLVLFFAQFLFLAGLLFAMFLPIFQLGQVASGIK